MALLDRFMDFATLFPHAESIDDLSLTEAQSNSKRADYFFCERKIVCELKSLEVDTRDKVDEITNKYKDDPDFPIFYDKWNIQKVLAHLPNGHAINEEIVRGVTSSVETLIRKANRQIGETKKAFDLRSSHGLVVILNDLVEIIDPELLGWRATDCLNKRRQDGGLRFESIDSIWIISETHGIKNAANIDVSMGIEIKGNTDASESAAEYTSYLSQQWATYNGANLMDSEYDVLDHLSPKSESEEDAKGHRMTNDELWAHEYAQNPYLRPLSHEEFIEYGRQLTKELGTMFELNAPSSAGRERPQGIEKFRHFLEEVAHRGVDMREFGS